MITGDYHHTAIAVARGAGMLPTGAKLVIIEAAPQAPAEAAQPSKMRSALKGDLAHAMASAAPLRVSFDLVHQPHVEARPECFGGVKLQPAQALLPVTNQMLQSLPEHVQGLPQSQAVSAQKQSSPLAQEQKTQLQDRLQSPSELLQESSNSTPCRFLANLPGPMTALVICTSMRTGTSHSPFFPVRKCNRRMCSPLQMSSLVVSPSPANLPQHKIIP